MSGDYDPFVPGPFPVVERTIEALDAARNRRFPIEIWAPDAPGPHPLIVFSHGTARDRRRMASYLCTHLSSHGYVVAALDHSETFAPELAPQPDETAEQKKARGAAWIANRVPDIRFLLDHLLSVDTTLDATRIGIVGFSFGGWTALAATEADRRIRAVVALAPGGSANPKPGIIPAKLTFAWGRDVPTLYLVGENDVLTPLSGIIDLYERTPATKQLVILRRADHAHFLDDAEEQHEAIRTMTWGGELAWIPGEMLPIAELCSGEQAHAFTRGLTLAHMDAVLREVDGAQRFMDGDLVGALAARGIDARVA